MRLCNVYFLPWNKTRIAGSNILDSLEGECGNIRTSFGALDGGLGGYDICFGTCNTGLCLCYIVLNLGNLESSEHAILSDVIADIHSNRLHIPWNLRHHIDFLVGAKLRR